MIPVSALVNQIYHNWNVFLLCLDVVLVLAGLAVFLLLRKKSKKVMLVAGCAVLFLSFLDGHLTSHPNFPEQTSFLLLCIGTGLLEFAGGLLLAMLLADIKKFFFKNAPKKAVPIG